MFEMGPKWWLGARTERLRCMIVSFLCHFTINNHCKTRNNGNSLSILNPMEPSIKTGADFDWVRFGGIYGDIKVFLSAAHTKKHIFNA
jgi:hypothetical protein